MTSGHPPVMVRGFNLPDFGINPSMLSGMQHHQHGHQQGQGQDTSTLFSFSGSNNDNNNNNMRQSSFSPTSSHGAFVIPHMRSWNSSSSNAANNNSANHDSESTGASTEELVDGLQQSLASMDSSDRDRDTDRPMSSYKHSSSSSASNKPPTNADYAPRATSSASSSSSAGGGGSVRPFDIRGPTYPFHGYRPAANQSSYPSSSFDSQSTFSQSLPPSLSRQTSSPAHLYSHQQQAAGQSQHLLSRSPSSFIIPGSADTLSNHNSLHRSGALSSNSNDGSETPRSPLQLFISPINGPPPALPGIPHGGGGGDSSGAASTSVGGNSLKAYYPFAQPDVVNNLDGRLSSFHRHQAHAHSNSYSSAFSPSSFLVNGLNSPTSLNQNQFTQQQQQQLQYQVQQHLQQQLHFQHQQQQQQLQEQSAAAAKAQNQNQARPSPPFATGSGSNDNISHNNSQESLHLAQGLKANNKRPSSTDSHGAAAATATAGGSQRGRTDSPLNANDETGSTSGKGQQARGRSQGRNPSSGKAPSQRSSRSRTRRPSYSRTISPAGMGGVRGATVSPPTAANGGAGAAGGSATSQQQATSGTNAGSSGSSYPNPYAPQHSPYKPGYPHLAGSSGGAISQENLLDHTNGGSASNVGTSSSGATPLQAHQQQIPASLAPVVPSGTLNWMKMAEQQLLQSQSQSASQGVDVQAAERKQSDASTSYISSSFDLLNSPAAFTGPLPLPHQEGFRSFGSLPAYLASLNGGDNGDGKGEGGEETRGRGSGPDDKRKKRRESHNAVERRRRDNINDRIGELASLIPEVLLDPASMQPKGNDKDESPDRRNGTGRGSDSPGFPASITTNNFTPAQLAQQAASNRPNKGIILSKSVDYIRYLQQLVQMQAERNRELEIRLRFLESGGHAAALQGGGGSGGAGGHMPAGLVGSPGLPLASMRSLPTLAETEGAVDGETGLSHKRDQFTAHRNASRSSLTGNESQHFKNLQQQQQQQQPQQQQTQQHLQQQQQQSHQQQQQQHSGHILAVDKSPSQDPMAMHQWLNSNGFAEASPGSQSAGDGGHDNGGHQMTFEDLLNVGRSNRVVAENESNSASSPRISVGKMEEDDENALGMQM